MEIEEATSMACFQKSKRMQNYNPWNIVPSSQPILQTVRDDNAVLVRSQQSFAVWIYDGGALDSNPMELGVTSNGTKEKMCLTIERSLLNTFLLGEIMTTLSPTGSYRCGQCQRKVRQYFCSVSYAFEQALVFW